MQKKSQIKAVFAAGAAAGALTVAGLAMMGPSAVAEQKVTPADPVGAAQSSGAPFSFADLVEDVSPAVVSVLVEREVEAPRVPSELEEFFQFRFGERGLRRDRAPGRGDRESFRGGSRTLQAQGSGFFIDGEGHIVTNNHVVEGATRVRVGLNNGDEVAAKIIGADPETDLAVLKVEDAGKYPFVEFSEDADLRVGDWVVAVGNPFGLSGTVTSGIVSAIGRETGGQFTNFIQVDAPINRGNSGGPTFDLRGRVVGVNTAIYSTTGGSVGIGFAIPAKVAKSTTDQLIKNGAVTRGWLGVQIQDVTENVAKAFSFDDTEGALVVDVIDGTPAQKGGLRADDLIVSVDGDTVENSRDLTRSISALPPGAKTKVKVVRDGKEKVLNVTLGKREATSIASNDNEDLGGDDMMAEDLGLRVSALDDELRDQYRIEDDVDGVVVTAVRPGSPADEAGLSAGVVISKVDGQTINSVSALQTKIESGVKEKRDALVLRLEVGGVKRIGALPLDELAE